MLNVVSVLTINGNGIANFANNVRHLTLTKLFVAIFYLFKYSQKNPFKFKSKQIFHYTRCITPKRVTS